MLEQLGGNFSGSGGIFFKEILYLSNVCLDEHYALFGCLAVDHTGKVGVDARQLADVVELESLHNSSHKLVCLLLCAAVLDQGLDSCQQSHLIFLFELDLLDQAYEHVEAAQHLIEAHINDVRGTRAGLLHGKRLFVHGDEAGVSSKEQV